MIGKTGRILDIDYNEKPKEYLIKFFNRFTTRLHSEDHMCWWLKETDINLKKEEYEKRKKEKLENIKKHIDIDPFCEEEWENESILTEGLNNLFKEKDSVKIKGEVYLFKYNEKFDFKEFEKMPYLFKRNVNVDGIFIGPSKYKLNNKILYIIASNIIYNGLENVYQDVYLTLLDNIWLKDEKEFAKRGMIQALLINKTKEIDPYQEENWEN
jgi:hypothetical protein